MSKTFNRGLMARKTLSDGPQTSVPNQASPSILIDADSGVDGLQNNVFVDSNEVPKNTIIPMGDVHQGRFTPFAKHWSACFNGANQYAQLSSRTTDIQLGQVFTIELFFCLSSNLTFKTSSGPYMGRLLSGNAGGMLELSVGGATAVPTQIDLTIYGGGYILKAAGMTIELNRWHHLAISRNAAGVCSMFFNGVRVATVINNTTTTAAGPAFVGGVNANGWYGYFPGYLSNMRVVKGYALYDPTQTTCTIPTDTLTNVPGTSILAFTKSNFSNQANPTAAVVHYNSPSMLPYAPFKNLNSVGGSAYFDGVGDYLKIPNHIGLSPEGQNFCIETFVYFKPGVANVCFFSKIEGAYPSTFEWVLSLFNGNALNFSVILTGGVTFDLSTTGDIIGGQWYHVAATRKGSVISLFVNGVRRVTKTINSAIWVTGSSVTVGKDLENATNRPLTGYLSNSRFVKGDYVYDPELTTLTVPEQPLSAIPGTRLLLKYENSGIHDLAGLSVIKTVGNARGRTDIKKDGTGSMFFDGSGDYLQIPHQDALNLSRGDFTIRLWLLLNGLPTTSGWTVLDKDGVNNAAYPQYAITVKPNGVIRCLTGNGTGTNPTFTEYLSTSAIGPYVWNHVVFQRRGNTIEIYINGILSYSGAVGIAPINGSKPLQIGGASDATGAFLNGRIDKLEIIQGRALYTANFTPE